jgi:hypothetical protein
MDDEVHLKAFEEMWTTEFDDYALIKTGSLQPPGYIVLHIPTDALVIIEDNDVFELVVKTMLEMGNKIVD